MNRLMLIEELKSYFPVDEAERSFAALFLELLQHPAAFERSHLPGHITGSAWIRDAGTNAVLLTHHAKLDKWLQPGGHADGDENVIRVATREAIEETGLRHLQPVRKTIFDIDIHPIPPRKDMPGHLHFDIRYLFHADSTAPLLVTAESHALEWFPAEDVARVSNDNASMIRMVAKMQH